MAIYLPGMKCTVCGKKIDNAEEAVLFPAFIANSMDTLIEFHDAVMHYDCFISHRDYMEIADLLKQRDAKLNPQNRTCELCNQKITEPEDYIAHACLSSRNDELLKYNFKQYHKKCYMNSINQREIKELVGKMEIEGLWSSNLEL